MNIVALTGRLTKDLDLKFTNSGKAVANFTLAVRRDFKNQNGEYESDFVSCQIWGNGAENLAKYTKKGVKIGVSGKIQTRNYDNQQGQRVYVTEVIVNTFDLLEKINENGTNNQQGYHYTPQGQNAPQGNYGANYGNGQNQQNYYANQHPPMDIQEDDLPF